MAVTLPVMEPYTYAVPSHLVPDIALGKRVLVPFGKRRVTGYVMAQCREIPSHNIKPICDILDETPLFPASMISFFKWIAAYYVYPIGQVIQSALPVGLTYNDISMLKITDQGIAWLLKHTKPSRERSLLERLHKRPRRLKEVYASDVNIPSSCVNTLVEKHLVCIEKIFAGNYVKPKLERFVSLKNPDFPETSRAVVQKKVVETLKQTGPLSISRLKQHIPTAANVLKSLEASGHITVTYEKIHRDPFGDPIAKDTPPLLTHEQDQVVTDIIKELGNGYKTYLLSGVTGSGKTEVYMHLAAEALNRGLRVLVLVPEIALISQAERRFRARFGDQVAILHSGLSKGERFDQWVRILEKKAPIVIGTRSAVFAPMDHIGLIVVDEEHDTSYKQDGTLMYNGRDLAVIRASFDQCIAVLGSATPSVQSYYNVNVGKYRHVTLTQRIEKRPLSEIQIVDLRHHKGIHGVRKYISSPLIQAMQTVLDRKEQVLLFINRRGYANMSVCGACGQPIKCKNCDIPLTLHQNINAHKCHYCGFSQASALHCPVCGSSFIQHLGMGTEKIEMAVSKLFPQARIARMDRDTTQRKGALLTILKDLKNNDIDILIGTQMVAKGHDFPNITLVGIICADLSLNFPDFRSGARTFQLLAQVAGRAGRGDVPGRVILQTYNPAHFCISAAQTQDFRVFYKQDLSFRKALKYPPFTRLAMFKISGRDLHITKQHALEMGKTLSTALHRIETFHPITLMGPIESAIYKIANQYRWQIILKARDTKILHAFLDHIQKAQKPLFSHPKVRVTIDVDPIFMM